MLKKILVCLDGSEFSEGLLPYAVERARYFNSNIILLKVTRSMVSALATALPSTSGQAIPILAPTQLDDMLRKEEAVDKLYLEKLATKLKKMGLEVDCVTCSIGGDTIANTIVAYSNENEVDLIMMATHGHSFWRRLVFGSVTESVIRKSASPVLVIRPETEIEKNNTFNPVPESGPA